MAKRNQTNTVPTASEAKEQAKLLQAAANAEEKGTKSDGGVISAVKDAVSNLLGGDSGDKENPNSVVEEFQSTVKPMAEQEANQPSDKDEAELRREIGGADNKGGVININSATAEEIMSVSPGIGDTMAKKIVEYRDKSRSGFRNLEDLDNVEGFSKERVEALAPHIVFTDAEIDTRSEEDKAKEQARIDAAKQSSAEKKASEEAGMKAGSNSFGAVNYKPHAKNKEEFSREIERVRSEAIDFVNKGDISLLAWLSLLAADMIYLATQADKEDRLAINFDLTLSSEALRPLIEAELKRAIDPHYVPQKKRTVKEDINRENATESVLDNASVQQYIPDAAKASLLLLKDKASFGWYDKTKGRPNWRTSVVSEEDMSDGESNPNMLRCLAAPYKSLRPSIKKTLTDDRTGKVIREDVAPNADTSLVYLNREFIGTLYGYMLNSNDFEEDKEGWYTRKVVKRDTKGTQDQQEKPADTNSNSNGKKSPEPELVKTEVNAFAKYSREHKNGIRIAEQAITFNVLTNELAKMDKRRKLIEDNELAKRVFCNTLATLVTKSREFIEVSEKGIIYLLKSDGKREVVQKLQSNDISKLLAQESAAEQEVEKKPDENKPQDTSKEASKTEEKAKETVAA